MSSRRRKIVLIFFYTNCPMWDERIWKLRIGRMDDLSADQRFVDIHKQTALSACPLPPQDSFGSIPREKEPIFRV
jgi:hypothetical protein